MSLSPTRTGNNGKGTYLADIFHVTIFKALPDASDTSWSWKQTFAIIFIANDG